MARMRLSSAGLVMLSTRIRVCAATSLVNSPPPFPRAYSRKASTSLTLAPALRRCSSASAPTSPTSTSSSPRPAALQGPSRPSWGTTAAGP
eukprot:CAMPEP_0198429060 /NCGR_PEP_ID=MMETSP1452-20131203/6949_1 /TAXON_ID=1181717 /ORGANISM="Synchroma pusillum, Strain CCMP3072" /LENGTH=90 /DNA_ID=CAMNT_0044149463 /DNA_START=109 /DNA_END=377 /DNA_ORIENTATION=+